MKINIGAGSTRYDGYVNCDYDSHYSPEYVFDIERDTWPFNDNSVDAVIAHHVLEHLGEGYFHALKELYRVCKSGAPIDIRVPHYNNHNFHHDATHRRAITNVGIMMFSKKYNAMCERENLATSRLGYWLDIDIEVIDSADIVDVVHPNYEALMALSKHDLFIMGHTSINVYSETHIKAMVCKGISREEQISDYYRGILQREPDPEGLHTYLHSNLSMEEIKNNILASPEYNTPR